MPSSGRVAVSEVAATENFPNMKTQSKNHDNQPVHKIRVGALSASIWKQNGDKGPMYNVSFQRSYREGEDWKTSTSFGKHDLLPLSLIATRAFEWIAAQAQSPDM